MSATSPPPDGDRPPPGTPPGLADAMRRHRDGDLAGAIRSYGEYLSAHPDDAEALFYHATALANSGRLEDGAQAFRRCLALVPERLEVALSLGEVCQHLGRLDEALGQFRRVLDARPQDPAAMLRVANVLLAAERAGEALGLYEAAAQRAVLDANAQRALARCHLMLGRWRDARAVCDRLLAQDAHDTAALAMGGVAARELEWRHADVRRPGPASSLFSLFPPPPEGFASVAQFNERLVRDLLEHADRAFAPADYSTRGGYQTGNLAREPGERFAPLVALIEGAVRRFVDGGRGGAQERYLQRPVNGWRLNVWGTILGESGHQDAHIHRSAWLSGVYYVQVPASVNATDPLRAGWIEFGHPPRQYPVEACYRLDTLRPVEGMMLLFPSYAYHRTIPLSGSQQRVSVAFDVMLG